MNTAGKVVVGVLVLGGIGAAVLLSGPKTASAAPKPPAPPPPPPTPAPGPPVAPSTQPQDHDPQAGGVVVVQPTPPAPGAPEAPAGVVPPPPGPVPAPAPGGTVVPLPGGGTATLPPGALPSVTPGANGGSVLNLPGGGQVPLPGVTPPAGAAPAPAPTQVLPGVTIPGTTPSSPSSTLPSAPADTIAVAQAMLDAEGPNTTWRSTPIPGLADWQRARGLTADSKFGPGSALRMAQEIGAIPIVRAWPAGSYPEGHWLPDYKASLQQIAQTKPEPHRSLLQAAAVRETGQGFGTPPKPILHTIGLEG